MNHTTAEDLALYAGSDTSLWARLRVGRHVRSCSDCRREVELVRTGQDSLIAMRESLPAEVDWESLAPVLKANIHVGLAAAECIANVGTREQPHWSPGRIAWGSAAAAIFLVGGWMIQRSPVGLAPVAVATVSAPARIPGETILKATAGALEMERDGRAMMLTYAGSPTVSSVTVASHALNARYVDDETGQVTIHHVYAE